MKSRALVIVVAVCSLVAVLHADYRDAFRRGIQASRRGRWAEVVTAMREARAEEPRDTGERINISGMEFMPYVPSFHLGLALYNVKDCGGALQAWQTLEGQGGIQRVSSGERGIVAKYRKDCEARVAALNKPTPPTEKPAAIDRPAPSERPAGPDPAALENAVQNANAAIERSQDAERALAPLAADELLNKLWRSDPSLGASEQRARETLNRARGDFETGQRESNLQRLQEAAAGAGVAAREFGAVRQAAESRRTQLANEAAAGAAAARDAGAKPAPPATKPEPTPTPLKPQPFTPPPALATAARLLFNAQYAEAAASLSRQRYPDGPAAGHAALLRAATSYSLYLVGGEKDDKLAAQARDAVREARRLAPALQPEPRAFSPRFIEFFNRTR